MSKQTAEFISVKNLDLYMPIIQSFNFFQNNRVITLRFSITTHDIIRFLEWHQMILHSLISGQQLNTFRGNFSNDIGHNPKNL